MTLIEKDILSGNLYHFYDGIDFDLIDRHPADGSAGFLVFFIDSFINEIKKYNREKKIDSFLTEKLFLPFDTHHLNHDYVSIYQTNGVGLMTMFDVVKSKILTYQDIKFKGDEYH